ncbi:MAG: biotin carboxylase, partial [Bacteroidetes bacterium]|nr:biotin carboxylase [Bacteroidota bacterium]
MNTRLQVEHPVTELITGVDLVKHMIYVAEGKPLALRQEDLAIKGHAVEVRVYAEDPATNFLPDVGTLHTYVRPQGNGVRVDDGFEQGMEIPIHYDPMITKLITYGQDREEAIQKMIRAIDEYQITGVQTTLPFCRFVMEHEAFRSGNFDTHFVAKYFTPDKLSPTPDADYRQVAALLTARVLEQSRKRAALPTPGEAPGAVSKWRNRKN